MIFETFEIDGLISIEPHVFTDDRGFFFESFNEDRYRELLGEQFKFVQDNISVSSKGVVRGLHFQSPPFAQGKLVSVLKGSVLDVAVDIRSGSPTYGQHVAVELSANNKKQFWIPPGFAHGFVALEDETLFSYKCTGYYSPNSEGTLLWNDTKLDIDWRVKNPIISMKDQVGQEFHTFASPFI